MEKDYIELGREGEDLARQHLVGKGYQILDSNYVWRKGEIDIVCQKENEIVFVEVKTRQTKAFGEPYKSVTRKKQAQIIKVANQYIQSMQTELDARFDVISIISNSKIKAIEHIENAFIPLV